MNEDFNKFCQSIHCKSVKALIYYFPIANNNYDIECLKFLLYDTDSYDAANSNGEPAYEFCRKIIDFFWDEYLKQQL